MPKIAVAGVKGSTGREFLNLLNESGIPADDVFALEAKAPLGTLMHPSSKPLLAIFLSWLLLQPALQQPEPLLLRSRCCKPFPVSSLRRRFWQR